MIDSGLVGSTDFHSSHPQGHGRGTARAEDAQGTHTQRHISLSILAYAETHARSLESSPEIRGRQAPVAAKWHDHHSSSLKAVLEFREGRAWGFSLTLTLSLSHSLTLTLSLSLAGERRGAAPGESGREWAREIYIGRESGEERER